MTFDNEMLTGHLRWVDKTDFMNDKDVHKTRTLQQQYKCWDSVRPTEIKYIWRDVPVVKITELGQ